VKTFFESYHGLAAQYGSTLAANCASCHGFHKILPSADPASTIHKNHLTQTCGKCHPGASEKFAQSRIHVDITTARAEGTLGLKINWWVRRVYLLLIVAVIGAMLVHNVLIFVKKVRARYRGSVLTIVRMTFSQRIQHMILGVSFIVLALSGFALRFPDSWLAKSLGSSEPIRRWLHRIAGLVLLAVGAYHVIYLLATRDGRNLAKDLLPNTKDVKDVVTNARYLTGLSRLKAQFARFGYAEKMEYWAVVWGTIIMGVTGLMIWFKMDVTNYFPRWLVDVALTIHYYEAILACLAIVVWHFYHVIFDPDVYPINWACWNGRVSAHWQEEEHPLDGNSECRVPVESTVDGNGHGNPRATRANEPRQLADSGPIGKRPADFVI
jgi:formate dehydrogenase gamma subunit